MLEAVGSHVKFTGIETNSNVTSAVGGGAIA